MNINASAAEAKTWYTYSATGQKLSVVYKWNSERQITPLTGSNLKAITGTVPDENSMDKALTLDYVGNFIYENESLKRILVVGGYIEDGNYYFYITDHLGNNRIVADASGDVVQSNEYYPFGLLMATSTEADKQPYKYGNKELDSYNGLNWYDFEARYFDGVRFTTPDPLSKKYYSISPYAYVANNPLKFIDPTGRKIVVVVGGKEYTYNGKGLVSSTGTNMNIPKNSHLNKIVNAYNDIRNSGDPYLASMVQHLMNSKNIHYIKGTQGSKNSVAPGSKKTTVSEDNANIKAGIGIGTTTQFNFSDKKKKEFKESEGVGVTDMEIVTHEMQHQFDYDIGNMVDDNTKDSNANNPSEIRAVNLENRARKNNKSDIRNTYGGNLIDPEKLEK